MKRSLLLAAAIWVLLPSPSMAQPTPPLAQAQSGNPEIDLIVNAFFERLRTGSASEAMSLILQSQLQANNTAERQTAIAQIASTLSTYGPARSYELVGTRAIGTMFVSRTYLAQHDTTLFRWRFNFVRLPRGWMISHLNLSDETENWTD